MMMSLLGIVFGIAFFIVTQAQTSGFQKVFIDTILGTSGAIRISDRFQDNESTINKVSTDGKTHFIFKNRENSRFIEGIDHPAEIIESLSNFPSVIGISEILETIGRLNSHSRGQSVQVHGLRIQDHIKVSNIENQLIQGSIENFEKDRMGILIGYRIAQRLNIKLGERVNLVGTKKNFQLRVSGIFETGLYQYDLTTIFMPFEVAQIHFKLRNSTSTIEILSKDINNLSELKYNIYKILGEDLNGVYVHDWKESNRSFIDALKIERTVMFLILTLIIIVAAFNIISSLIMLVNDKKKNIACLRVMGMHKSGIIKIFLISGGVIGFSGTLLGLAIGILFSANINSIKEWIDNMTESTLFDPTIYFLSNLPSKIFISDVALVTSMSILISFLATIYPALKASKTNPSEILK